MSHYYRNCSFLYRSLPSIALTHYSLVSMKRMFIALILAFAVFAPIIFSATQVYALDCPEGSVEGTAEATGEPTCVYVEKCPPGQTVAADGPNSGAKYVCCPDGTEDNATKCYFAKYIDPTVKLLASIAGAVAVLGIAVGGIQYAASAGDSQKVAAGKAKVTKALLGIVAFMFLFAGLQFLSPGGFSTTAKLPPGTDASAESCSKEFFGLKPWFIYMPDENFNSNCQIIDFNLLPAEGNPSDVVPVVLAIVDNLVRIAAVVAVVFVVVGGVKYVTSQGEPDGVKSAKDSIINAMIGLVIAIIAASVVSFIGNQLKP